MELLDPVPGVGDQEVAHLVAAEVEDQGAPVGVFAAAGVDVLVEGGAVEPRQRPLVAREVGGHPVEDDADAALVELVDHRPEVVRRAEARGRRVVAAHLVAPRAAEGVLGEGQELDVGEPHRAAVVAQLRRRLAVGQHLLARLAAAPPRGQVHLVRGHRPHRRVGRRPAGDPLAVGPAVLAHVDHARGRGRGLRGPGQRVGLEHPAAVRPGDRELVVTAGAHPGEEHLPDPGGAERAHRVEAVVPVAGVADQPDAAGVGRPDREGGADHPLVLDHPGAEAAPELAVLALADEVEVEVAEGGQEAVGVVDHPAALPLVEAQPVGGQLGNRYPALEDAALEALQRALTTLPDHRAALRRRMEGAHHGLLAEGVGAEDPVGLVLLPAEQPDGVLAEVGKGRGGGAGVGRTACRAHGRPPSSRNRSGVLTQSGRWPSS